MQAYLQAASGGGLIEREKMAHDLRLCGLARSTPAELVLDRRRLPPAQDLSGHSVLGPAGKKSQGCWPVLQ